MKVLLYEGRKTGHGPIWLTYTIDACRKAGFAIHLIDEALPLGQEQSTYDALQSIARETGCNLIHILTFDHFVREWLRLRRPIRDAIPLIGTYFRFTSLWRFPHCLFWSLLFRRKLLDGLLVPDPFLKSRLLLPAVRARVWEVPDTWRHEVSPSMERPLIEAEGKTLMMMFGDLSQRKGVSLFLAALELLPTESSILGILVGQVEQAVRQEMGSRIERLIASGRLRLFDEWVQEEDVLKWFESCHYVVCPYPRDFEFSSGTFMRGCACGKPVIVPSHGLLGRLVPMLDNGLVYKSNRRRVAWELARALIKAESLFKTPAYTRMSRSGTEYAARSSWDAYAEAIRISYSGILQKKSSHSVER